jgi:hypothetical protein
MSTPAISREPTSEGSISALNESTDQHTPKPDDTKRVNITNETAHRLVIGGRGRSGIPLVLTPFGSRVIAAAEADSLELAEWVSRGLVTRNDAAKSDASDKGYVAIGLGVIGFLVFGLATIGVYLISSALGSTAISWTVGLGAATAISLAIAIAGGLQHSGRDVGVLRPAGDAVLRSLTMIAIGLIGFGLPAILAIGVDRQYHIALVEYLQWISIAITCIAPASFYFLFTRQRSDALRESFVREILVLDPSIWTRSEAATKYQNLMSDLSGGMYRYGLAVPVVSATLLMAAGWLLIVEGSTVGPSAQLPLTLREALVFGFLGTYFFAIQMTFRRYLRSDLSPKAYSQVVVRTLVTVILVAVLWVITASGTLASNAAISLLFVIAFVIGVVPETGVTLVRQYLKTNPLTRRIASGLDLEWTGAHPVTVLDGINLYDRARLLEEGIENIENLAHSNLIELMLSTRIATSRLVDLFDQAILYLHLSDGNTEPTEDWGRLRRYGIRTATDLEAAIDRATLRGETHLTQLLNVLPNERGARLRSILDVLHNDEWMINLRSWRQGFGTFRTINSPEEFNQY